jgi:flagellar hook-length control protein FliK
MNADAVQNFGTIAPTASTAGSATTAAASPNTSPQTLPAAVTLAGVAVAIAAQVQDSKNHFQIRLDPPELGHIEVKLNVDHDGHVTSRLVVDRADTLDLLKRDSAHLERALQDAGLKTFGNALQFSLRQQSFGQDNQTAPQGAAAQLFVPDDEAAPLDALRQGHGRLIGLGGGLDIRV